jgi:hypothetical protein
VAFLSTEHSIWLVKSAQLRSMSAVLLSSCVHVSALPAPAVSAVHVAFGAAINMGEAPALMLHCKCIEPNILLIKCISALPGCAVTCALMCTCIPATLNDGPSLAHRRSHGRRSYRRRAAPGRRRQCQGRWQPPVSAPSPAARQRRRRSCCRARGRRRARPAPSTSSPLQVRGASSTIYSNHVQLCGASETEFGRLYSLEY